MGEKMQENMSFSTTIASNGIIVDYYDPSYDKPIKMIFTSIEEFVNWIKENIVLDN